MPELKREKRLSEMEPRLKRFAELLATGTKTVTAAAIEAGFTPQTADKWAYRWLRETREDSFYPQLFDYYKKLNDKHLRKIEATTDNILKEISLIAFSDISKFVDLPRMEYERKKLRAIEIERAIFDVENYERWKERKQKEEKDGRGPGRPSKVPDPDQPTEEQYQFHFYFQSLNQEQRNEIMIWRNYASGSIRVKYQEEIPADLMPCVAEISNTQDGIKLKLHSKMEALDKLAKIMKMYDDSKKEQDDEKPNMITSINLIVNGSKSNLLTPEVSVKPQGK